MENQPHDLKDQIEIALARVPDYALSEFYSHEQRLSLISELRIEPKNVAEFIARLESAVSLLPKINMIHGEMPKPKEVLNGWKNVLNRLDKLIEAFDGLANLTGGPLHTNLAFSQLDKFEGENPVYVNEPLSFENKEAYDQLVDPYMERSETLIAGLHVLRSQVLDEINDLPKPKQGQTIDPVLRTWIASLRCIWEEILGRKFTRDVAPNGEPISEAAVFVSLASRPLPFDEKQCLNMMRRLISEKNS